MRFFIWGGFIGELAWEMEMEMEMEMEGFEMEKGKNRSG